MQLLNSVTADEETKAHESKIGESSSINEVVLTPKLSNKAKLESAETLYGNARVSFLRKKYVFQTIYSQQLPTLCLFWTISFKNYCNVIVTFIVFVHLQRDTKKENFLDDLSVWIYENWERKKNSKLSQK